MLSINRTYCHSTMNEAYFLKSITQTVLLEKQAASLSPSLFQQTSKMPPPPLYVLKTFPSLTDHIWRHWSRDPLARYSPLGLKATEYTGCLQLNNELMTDTDKRSSDNVYGIDIVNCVYYLWPAKLWRRHPWSMSHSLMVESKEALKRSCATHNH